MKGRNWTGELNYSHSFDQIWITKTSFCLVYWVKSTPSTLWLRLHCMPLVAAYRLGVATHHSEKQRLLPAICRWWIHPSCREPHCSDFMLVVWGDAREEKSTPLLQDQQAGLLHSVPISLSSCYYSLWAGTVATIPLCHWQRIFGSLFPRIHMSLDPSSNPLPSWLLQQLLWGWVKNIFCGMSGCAGALCAWSICVPPTHTPLRVLNGTGELSVMQRALLLISAAWGNFT